MTVSTAAPTPPHPAASVVLPGAPASPWRRLMCVVYEGILLFGVVFFVGYAYSALTQFRGGEAGPLRTGLQAFELAALAAYFIGLWSNGRRTLPMKTMQVHLSGPDGARVSPLRASVRFAAAALSAFGPLAAVQAWGPRGALLWLPVLLAPLVDRRRRALHDLVARTLLLRDAPLPRR